MTVPKPRRIGVTVRYRHEFGDDSVSGDLSDAWAQPFEHSQPIRPLVSYKGQRNFTGAWWCATTRAHVGFESWVERDHLMAFDHDPQVIGIASQPFELALNAGGRSRRHVPDYFLRHRDGSATVVDIRPDDRVKERDREVFDATADACALVGWSYQRLGVAEPVRTANLRWLAGYRHPRCAGPVDVWRSMIGVLDGGPLSLVALGERLGHPPVAALPWIYHRLWMNDIVQVGADQRLSMRSLVELPGGAR